MKGDEIVMKMCVVLKDGVDYLTVQRELLSRGFGVSFSSSFSRIWIHNINYVFGNKEYIWIETKESSSYDIKIDDIEYYEIHKDK